MFDWVNVLQTAPNAGQIAFWLALFSAFFHAVFGALQKGRNDPLLIRAANDFWFVVLWLPIAIMFVPWPTSYEWLLILGVFPIHTAYKLVLAQAYRAGDYSFIYPVARGSAPFFTAIFALLVFSEQLSVMQWFGVLLISLSIILLGLLALRNSKMNSLMVKKATIFALMTGALITAYSIYDAYGVRNSRNPFIFLAWFYVMDGWLFPLLVMWRRTHYTPIDGYAPLLSHGLIMALFGILSFSAIFIAADIGNVGEVFALRETSVVWAAVIGFIFLKEKMTPLRFLVIVLIAMGAIFIKLGSQL